MIVQDVSRVGESVVGATTIGAQFAVVLDGEMSLSLEGSADCQLVVPEQAESGVVTVLHTGRLPAYEGVTVVTPMAQEQVLETSDTSVYDDILILQIPYTEVSNESGGYTVSIG